MNEAGGDYFTKVSKGTARGREADGVFTGGNGENRGLTHWMGDFLRGKAKQASECGAI